MFMPTGGRARRVALSMCLTAALPLIVGCADSANTVASPVVPPPAPPSPTASRVIYDGPPDLYGAFNSFHNGPLVTRYVLYGDGTFALEFYSPRFGPGVYTGRYKRTDSRIVFDWDGWSTAGPWGAEGTLRGDSLTVTYNTVMMLSDFVDGTYVRSSSTP